MEGQFSFIYCVFLSLISQHMFPLCCSAASRFIYLLNTLPLPCECAPHHILRICLLPVSLFSSLRSARLFIYLFIFPSHLSSRCLILIFTLFVGRPDGAHACSEPWPRCHGEAAPKLWHWCEHPGLRGLHGPDVRQRTRAHSHRSFTAGDRLLWPQPHRQGTFFKCKAEMAAWCQTEELQISMLRRCCISYTGEDVNRY